jgi:hypothetical protein
VNILKAGDILKLHFYGIGGFLNKIYSLGKGNLKFISVMLAEICFHR